MNLPRNSWKNTNKSGQGVMKHASVVLNKGLSCQSQQHCPKMHDAILEVISYTKPLSLVMLPSGIYLVTSFFR